MKLLFPVWPMAAILFLSGCAAVGVKVEKTGDGRLRREALAIAESNKGSGAARLLAEGYRKKSPEAERAAAFFGALGFLQKSGANPPFQKSASKSSACLGVRILTPIFRKQAAGK